MLKIFFNYLLNIKWLLISTIIFLILYQFIIKYWWYFERNNVKFVRGWPILGSHYRMVFGLDSISESFRKLYEKFPTEKLFGIYEFGGSPSYVIRDPELIKKITIKDFDHFVNHRFVVDTEADSLLGRTIFFMKDQKWKDMRAALSPAFTGSKMKMMFNIMLKCSQQLVDQLEMDINKVDGVAICEMKNILTRFTNDSIATCAFGLELNSLRDVNNEFYQTGKAIANLDGLRAIKFFGYANVPNFMKYFKIQFLTKSETNYFRNLVLSCIGHREKNNIHRPDIIHLLMEARKGLLKSDDDESAGNIDQTEQNGSTGMKKWEDDDIVAQSVLFFVAGYDTMSTVLSFTAHALAVYPDVQSRLYEEICEINDSISSTVDENGIQTSTSGSITYEHLNRMKYLDMVLNETMRMWTPTQPIERITTKPYTIELDTGEKVKFNVGDGVWLPAPGIHMDKKYFPNPEVYDPERFNEVNIKNIHPYTHMPFGFGPRGCLGIRFGLANCKIILYNLLLKFKLEICEKTENPLKLRRNTANIDAANGFWLKVVLRKNNRDI